MICSCFFFNFPCGAFVNATYWWIVNGLDEKLSISCLSPVIARQPWWSMKQRDFQHILQSIWRNCANAHYWNFFYWRFSWIHRRRDWQLDRKGRFLFLRTEVCLRGLSLHFAQSSKFPSIFNSSSLNLDYAKRKKTKIQYRGVSKSWKVIYYHRCKFISCTRLKVIKQQWVTWLWVEILLVMLESESALWGSKCTLQNQ